MKCELTQPLVSVGGYGSFQPYFSDWSNDGNDAALLEWSIFDGFDSPDGIFAEHKS